MPRQNNRIKEIEKEVGNRLKSLRMSLGISRASLSRKINISHQQFAKYELGTNNCSIGRLIMISEALDCPITYFTEGLENVTRTQPLLIHRLTKQVSRNFQLIKSDSNRYAVNQLVRTLAENA